MAQTFGSWNGKTVGTSSGNVSSLDGKTIGTSTGNYNKWNNLTSPGGASSTAYVTGQTLGTLRNDFTGCVGFAFTPNSAITITDLGRWVVSGNSQSHTVLIMDGSSPFSTIVSAAVNTSGAMAGAFLFASVTPTVLTSGHGYWIGTVETNAGDQFYNNDTTITVTGAATEGVSAFHSGTCPASFGSSTASPHAFGPVNFKYQ